jgi:hypothetical protein
LVRLRVDPWDPEYGASSEIDLDLAPPVGLDLTVEVPGPWAPIPVAALAKPACCVFIDGVRRVEVQLYADQDEKQGPGLAGSWAAGCAWSTKPPKIVDIVVGRVLVLGNGLLPPALEVPVGKHRMTFAPHSVSGAAPLDPLRGLQNLMRGAEARLARETLEAGQADLVVSDGPLNYFLPGPALGMVKRQSRSYLDVNRAQVLTQLKPGERTPIFKLGGQRLERYSWYLRLSQPRAIDGTMAGMVRLEVAADPGLELAQRLADLAGGTLPLFASQPGHDPRAPQNVYPVGALEAVLRHRLGDAALIRRNFEAQLLVEVT